MDGTIEQLAGMMDTPIYGLMGVSICNEKDEWEYLVAVATTKEKGDFEELVVPPSTWAVFYEEAPVIKMQELETRIVTEWLPTSGFVTSYTSPVTGKALLLFTYMPGWLFLFHGWRGI